MRYLVTGGAGFIGSNIVDELVKRGQEVVVLDDLSAGKEANLAAVREKIDLHIGTVTDLAAAQSACKGVQFVIHLAARTSVPRSVLNPLESNRVNIDGTLNVLVAARDAQVRRFVFAASSAAYGETPTLPKVETMQPQPISPYGVTKYVGEMYAQVFGRVYGLENASHPLLQCVWAAAGSHFAIFWRAFAVHAGGDRRAGAGDLWRRGAIAGFHLCGERGGRDAARLRGAWCVGNGVQRRNWGADHFESGVENAFAQSREKPFMRNMIARAQRRYTRFAGGCFAGAEDAGLRAAGAVRRGTAANLGVVQENLREELAGFCSARSSVYFRYAGRSLRVSSIMSGGCARRLSVPKP